jgi:hypothetical protein
VFVYANFSGYSNISGSAGAYPPNNAPLKKISSN